MYSGTTLTKYSGRIMGSHQKIDRVARQYLDPYLKSPKAFPRIKSILQFEGLKGPDAIKRKSPARDEPWHYIDPFNKNDTELIEMIADHYQKLIEALRQDNYERSSFEAAWLAHGLVDGMTPAHHYPYENELMELRGEGRETRTTWKKKIVLPGETTSEKMLNNWKMWGPKGLLMAHVWFEIGAAGVIAPLSFAKLTIDDNDFESALESGIVDLFVKSAREVAVLGMYDKYYSWGWTPKLALQVKNKLAPTMIKTVILAWWLAAKEAGAVKS